MSETFEHVTRLLEDSRAELEQATEGLPDEFCSRKPADKGWSITEIVEHLIIVEKRVAQMLQNQLSQQELSPDPSGTPEKDMKLVKRVASYAVKIEAPDSTKPTGQYKDCRQALGDFGACRQRTLDYAASATPNLRGRLLPHPFLGPIDGCQWLLALAAHTQRHVKQISNTKSALQQESASQVA